MLKFFRKEKAVVTAKERPLFTLSEGDIHDRKRKLIFPTLSAHLPADHFKDKQPITDEAKLFKKFDATLCAEGICKGSMPMMEFEDALESFQKKYPEQKDIYKAVFARFQLLWTNSQPKLFSGGPILKKLGTMHDGTGKLRHDKVLDYFMDAGNVDDLNQSVNGNGVTLLQVVQAYDNSFDPKLPEGFRNSQKEKYDALMKDYGHNYLSTLKRNVFDEHAKLRDLQKQDLS